MTESTTTRCAFAGCERPHRDDSGWCAPHESNVRLLMDLGDTVRTDVSDEGWTDIHMRVLALQIASLRADGDAVAALMPENVILARAMLMSSAALTALILRQWHPGEELEALAELQAHWLAGTTPTEPGPEVEEPQ